MSNFSFDEQTIRVPANGSRPYPLPEGTAGIVVSAPSGFTLTDITITCGIHVYTPNANSNPVFIPTTRTLREVIFANSSSSLVAVNVTALGHAAAQAWAASNGTGVVSLTGRNGSYGDVVVYDASGNPINVIGDGDNVGAGLQLGTNAHGEGFDGNYWVKKRVSNGVTHVLSPASVASGTYSGAIWTPATNKRFRLLWAMISIGTATDILLVDQTATVGDLDQQAGLIQLRLPPNGYLSLTANNVLRLYNNGGVASIVSGFAFGTEE